MTNQNVINFLNQVRKILLDDKSWLESTIQPINEAFDMEISALQEQEAKRLIESSLTQKPLDTISRTTAIDALMEIMDRPNHADFLYTDEICKTLNNLPSSPPEPSIPISWIEKQIDWLKSMDNEFSNITAMNISALVKKWRKENGKDKQSD